MEVAFDRNLDGTNCKEVLQKLICSRRFETLAIVLSKYATPTQYDLIEALSMLYEDIFELLCKHASSEHKNFVLPLTCKSWPEKYATILLDNGANPNTNKGLAMRVAVECGRLDVLKLLHKYGGILTVDLFDIACYNWENKVAYWLYLNGIYDQNVETESFRSYKEEQNEKRQVAARKIYFWYLSKLMKNKAFLMKQASKKYDELFNTNDP